MQIIYILLASFAIACALVYLQKRSGKNSPSNTQNPYLGLREQALLTRPAQLRLQLSENEETAFGVVVDLGMNNGSATIVAFATGDASMYTSSGGGIIGGGVSHANVKSSAVNLVSVAQKFFTKMQKASDLNTPKSGYIKFYSLTNKATYSFEGKEAEITDPNSPWAELFYAANEVITQLRIASNM
ncbi:MAG: hypothetical protein JSU01_02540 [Bacteroidetes bacterium]|nr:hypothetical protein [Bacteroidota bacterium]